MHAHIENCLSIFDYIWPNLHINCLLLTCVRMLPFVSLKHAINAHKYPLTLENDLSHHLWQIIGGYYYKAVNIYL